MIKFIDVTPMKKRVNLGYVLTERIEAASCLMTTESDEFKLLTSQVLDTCDALANMLVSDDLLDTLKIYGGIDGDAYSVCNSVVKKSAHFTFRRVLETKLISLIKEYTQDRRLKMAVMLLDKSGAVDNTLGGYTEDFKKLEEMQNARVNAFFAGRNPPEKASRVWFAKAFPEIKTMFNKP